MSLTIEDAQTDRLARKKRRRGQGIDKQAVTTIVRRIEALPTVDNRTADDILSYHERGLPT